MKPQDLMVGDLISMGGVIRVVTGIHDKETENGVDLITTMIPGHTFPDSNLSFRASYCYPIPLTPEILEKNGFHFTKADRMSLTDRYVLGVKGTRDGAIVEITFYNPDAHGVKVLTKIHTQSSHESGINSVHSCDIESVHELQRALRLCKIDKTIEL